MSEDAKVEGSNNNTEEKPTTNESEQTTQKKESAVKDYGVFYDQNWQHRRKMEDAHHIEDKYLGDSSTAFFGIYDGHGGKDAAVFSAQNLHKVLEEELKQQDIFTEAEKVKEALTKTFALTDEKMKSTVPPHHGCTVIVSVVTGLGNSRQLYTANAGDARAVLCRGGKAIRLSEDHTANNTVESQRITESGGFIINGRVNGHIVITRSLGDHLMKEFIINTPHLYHTPLSEEDSHLILACDGLWDVVQDQEAVNFLLENDKYTATDLAKRLVVKALEAGSTDNLSVIVVKL